MLMTDTGEAWRCRCHVSHATPVATLAASAGAIRHSLLLQPRQRAHTAAATIAFSAIMPPPPCVCHERRDADEGGEFSIERLRERY